MRVAYICADPGVPVFGAKGSSVHVQSVIRALLRRGAQVTLFAARFDGDVPEGLEGVTCHALPGAPKGDVAARESALMAANDELAAQLAASQPFDLVYERYSLWSYAAMEHAQASGLPGLLEINAPLVEEQARYRTLVNRVAAEAVAWRAFGAASALIAVSRGVADYLRAGSYLSGRVHVIPNGVDPARFSATQEAAGAKGAFTVGFVGTLKPWHGLEVLLAAFVLLRRQVPGARLLLVGDGPGRPAVERRIQALALEGAVILTGAVSPAAVPTLLAQMDVATAPYTADDGCYFSPLKLFEYMASGRAIATSRVGQVAEVITHGRNGMLCAPGDAVELAAVLGALAADPALRRRLGAAARADAIAHHTWDAVAGKILALAGLAEPTEVRVRHA